MEEKDLKQIREVFREEFKKGFTESFSEVWEGNLEPAFDKVYEEIDGVKDDLRVIEAKLGIAPPANPD